MKSKRASSLVDSVQESARYDGQAIVKLTEIERFTFTIIKCIKEVEHLIHFLPFLLRLDDIFASLLYGF